MLFAVFNDDKPTFDGSFTPANGWPARFSFDAVRIPLYLSWEQIIKAYWQGFARTETPAWVNVVTAARRGLLLVLLVPTLLVGSKTVVSEY